MTASMASEAPSFETGIEPNIAMIPYSMQPPHLAMITHGKLSSHHLSQIQPPTPEHYNVQCLYCLTQIDRLLPTLLRVPLRVRFSSPHFHFSKTRRQMSRLRKFDTEPQSSNCYEVEPDNRLESVANAHTAADLHVRPVP